MPKDRKGNKNTGLKILSVVFALLLWLYVVGEGQNPAQHTAREVNLQYYNLSEGLTVQGPDTVRVRVWGEKGDKKEEIEAYVDLTGLAEGNYRLPVKVKTLKGALLTTVEPKEVEVKINRISKHTFSINYRLTGNLPEGYELLGVDIFPSTCLLKGEETDLKKVSEVICDINLSGVRETAIMELPLRAVDGKGNEVKGDFKLLPPKATVYVVAGQMLKNKEVAINLVVEGNLEAGFTLGEVSVIPDKITVLGNPTIIENLEKIDTLPVSLEGKTLSFSQKVKLALPDKVKAYPAEVLVNVEIKKKEIE
ncbi:CdaR family protein [Thermosyntropha lipolytica]|nr:CdaR family protein [Thermosyntropha lipolytica]